MLWFCSNYFYNNGLSKTSVASSAVLCNTSAIFVYLISLCLLKNTKFDILKGFSVICSFTGIVIVTFSDTSDSDDKKNKNEFLGNMLSLLSALFYGLYAVILKRRIPDE